MRHEDVPLRQHEDHADGGHHDDPGGVPTARSSADGVDPAADHAAFQAAFHGGATPSAHPHDFIDDFVDLVGHHLRTPLTAIRTLLELLADDQAEGLDPATAKRLVNAVKANSDRMLRVIDTLLLLARARHADAARDHVPVDLAAVVDRVGSAMAPAADGSGVAVTVEAKHPVWTVGDPILLERAIGHLAGNALRFTDRGGRLSLRALAEPKPAVEVQDTGVGIDPERQRGLLRPLRLVLGESDGHDENAHLGLGTVSAIARAHQGDLDVRSAPGHGTTFRLTFPTVPSPH
ncbi:sensor histidine kinase [Cryptosporangium aurantiacum]|uniref:histidine kinase n=1 Tax=Cryptosporangium aurantiacum TaxID=134849 RepID=A0A1M7RIL9_9ACTN|nr:HAMP domain-containing sensor histidine kinase [Cryptosporangium aurantiacum]SHN46046.1 His Kinase A (phospho-acceptor) domain-containing protein [Cryptosporangium aurantiacum]